MVCNGSPLGVLYMGLPQGIRYGAVYKVLRVWKGHPEEEKFVELHGGTLRIAAAYTIDR